LYPEIFQLGQVNPYVICSMNRRPDHPELIQPNDIEKSSMAFQDEMIQVGRLQIGLLYFLERGGLCWETTK
jgi:hypothetical protein